MSITPLNHYSLANPATVFDEESLTVLQLCGRLAAKVNEVVESQNSLVENVNNTILITVREWLEENGLDVTHVTPQMFGAKGDGLEDDTLAIQTALATGKDVYLKEGVYLITDTLLVPGAQRVYGSGPNCIIKGACEVLMKTQAAGAVIESIKFSGNGENAGLSVFKNNQAIVNCSFYYLLYGIKNANSDYVGTVRVMRCNFDECNVCFYSDTLTNGVAFENCVAYRYTNFITAYWMEAVSLDNCFIEAGNTGAGVIGLAPGKTLIYMYSVNLHGCYIENGASLIHGRSTGTINFDGCWLFNYPYLASTGSKTRFNFNSCTFAISASGNAADVIHTFAEGESAYYSRCICMKNGAGSFEFTDNNYSGGTVTLLENNKKGGGEIIRKRIFTGITDTRGMVYLADLEGNTWEGITILESLAWPPNYSSYYITENLMSGNRRIVQVRDLSGDDVAEQEVIIHVYYMETGDIVTDEDEYGALPVTAG